MSASRIGWSRLVQWARLPLFYNAGYLLGVNLLPALAGFLFWTIASRLCLPAEVGLASAVISAGSLLSCIAAFGTNLGLICFLPAHQAPRRLLNAVLTFSALSSLAISVLFLVGAPLWAPRLSTLASHWVWIVLLLLFVLASTWGTALRDSFVAFRQSRWGFTYTALTNGLRLLLIFPGISFGAIGLLGATSFSFLLAFWLSIVFFSARVIPGYRWQFQSFWPEIRSILPFSLSNFLTMLILQTTQAVLPLMTTEKLGVEANAYAFVALMLGMQISSPGMALATSALAEGANDLQHRHQILLKTFHVALAITLPISVVVYLLAPWLLQIFGPDYAVEGTALLRWLSFSAVFQVVNHLYLTKLRLENRNIWLILISALSMVSTLTVTYLCLERLGVVANGIALVVGNAIPSLIVVGELLWSGRSQGRPI